MKLWESTPRGLTRRELWRRRTRTFSRLPYAARLLPAPRRPLWRGWFYAQVRAMGNTRREAWHDSKVATAMSVVLRYGLER